MRVYGKEFVKITVRQMGWDGGTETPLALYICYISPYAGVCKNNNINAKRDGKTVPQKTISNRRTETPLPLYICYIPLYAGVRRNNNNNAKRDGETVRPSDLKESFIYRCFGGVSEGSPGNHAQ